MGHLLAAPDKFRGTATARAIADACADAARQCGWSATALPLSDGGDGLLDALGGIVHECTVTGPLGRPVRCEWRMLDLPGDGTGPTAVVEMAQASGLALVGGSSGNDPIAATTRGTGEVIADAIASGAHRVIIGCGGSATTDGGAGALDALTGGGGLGDVELIVACDVSTRFLDAATVFAPQKGATDEGVGVLSAQLRTIAGDYRSRFGVDVSVVDGSGAAGGLAGGLLMLGASLVPGFDLVADLVGLDDKIAKSDFVMTGEGRIDATSFAGKVVGGLISRIGDAVPVLCIAGEIEANTPHLQHRAELVSLTERFGRNRAMGAPAECCAQIVREHLLKVSD